MPIYEYQCQHCGHVLEATQRISDPPLTECPACQKPQLSRLISMTSFQLKGGGWGKDGYRKDKPHRTENQRIDRLTKAIEDDKKKTAAASTDASGGSDSGTSSSTSTSTSTSTTKSGGSSSTT